MRRFVSSLIGVSLLFGCSGSATEKRQRIRDNAIDIHTSIREIDLGGMALGPHVTIRLLGEYILLLDGTSFGKLMHVLDQATFAHVYSGIQKGRGPGEVVTPGNLMTDESRGRFFLADYGKNRLLCYEMAQFLKEGVHYMPQTLFELDPTQFPADSFYIDDDCLIGTIVVPIGRSHFNQRVARWSMNTQQIVPMPYECPDVGTRRIGCAVSPEHGIYVETYKNRDLLTICSLDGTPRCDIYGPLWDPAPSDDRFHFGDAVFCRDRILIPYSGRKYDSEAWRPTSILVFDTDGNYLKTLDTGYKLNRLCYDERSDRLLLTMDDTVQFAYYDLKEL